MFMSVFTDDEYKYLPRLWSCRQIFFA